MEFAINNNNRTPTSASILNDEERGKLNLSDLISIDKYLHLLIILQYAIGF